MINNFQIVLFFYLKGYVPGTGFFHRLQANLVIWAQ
jgi:hypothetical protein